ncbi:hypothetical protein [Aquimarina intermedia]|uniref:Uncharacterized protein n=1 Tax=Aquimarina intermedia TaxID=350814 RepID=A0A5S5BUN0_9FLAO|nr:hypothetical protein [Aquimarina intermedia]TYP70881.1 hypothetical protein BD809_11149 [Aquimarina intermedia]
MKNILILIALILSSCQKKSKEVTVEVTVEDTVKNPFRKVETLVEMTEIDAPEIKMLEYLSVKYTRIQDSTFLKKPDWMLANGTEDVICGYIISFKEGHSFAHQQECNEWGR